MCLVQIPLAVTSVFQRLLCLRYVCIYIRIYVFRLESTLSLSTEQAKMIELMSPGTALQHDRQGFDN